MECKNLSKTPPSNWFLFSPWFLRALVGQTLRAPPASTKSESCFSGHTPVPTYWRQTLSICEDSTQGFDFVEPETWYNKKTWTEKYGVAGLDFVENAGSDLTLVCDFVEAPLPLFNFVPTKMSAPNPTTLIGERIFQLTNVLRATTACNSSPLIWPAGSAPAADPPEPQIIGKTRCIATFLPFRAPASSCFPLFLFSDLLTSWLLLSDSSHLCFSISAYCRKFDF